MKRAFLSYALKDRYLKDRFVLAMSELENDGLIMIWQDLHGAPGTKVAEQIERQIDRAEIFIALITPDFLRSKYCVNVELKRAAIRAKAGRCDSLRAHDSTRSARCGNPNTAVRLSGTDFVIPAT